MRSGTLWKRKLDHAGICHKDLLSSNFLLQNGFFLLENGAEVMYDMHDRFRPRQEEPVPLAGVETNRFYLTNMYSSEGAH